MSSKKGIQLGILFCSLGILLSWTAYFFLFSLPDISRLPEHEHQEQIWATFWHLPSVFPALLGIFMFKMEFLNKKVLYLYLSSFLLFLLCYGWSTIATGPIAAGLPLLLLWSLNAFLLFYILDLYIKKNQEKNLSL